MQRPPERYNREDFLFWKKALADEVPINHFLPYLKEKTMQNAKIKVKYPVYNKTLSAAGICSYKDHVNMTDPYERVGFATTLASLYMTDERLASQQQLDIFVSLVSDIVDTLDNAKTDGISSIEFTEQLMSVFLDNAKDYADEQRDLLELLIKKYKDYYTPGVVK